ncbi:hypothetical protein O3P69_016620 [Scylla paramamosain]|uniref:Peptidase S1 domain-containing protein n=1 Tax=Scylla paramamosain TaxID=85552 RepID=A0AAW0SY94_SCYPA
MLRLCILAVSLSLAVAVPYIPLLGAKELPSLPRIVGGEDATPGEFPYQVSIQKQGLFGRSHMCGASVLNDHHVLTAAHCLKGANTNSLYVVMGEYDLGKNSGDEQVIVAGELVIHEHYDAATYTNDVGIIRVVPSITFNDKVTAVDLPAEMGLVEAGTECVTTGWGATEEGGSSSDILKKVTVPVVSDADCRASYGITDIADHMLCAGHGITSWGYGCARPDYPGVYTEVAYFVDWINRHSA